MVVAERAFVVAVVLTLLPCCGQAQMGSPGNGKCPDLTSVGPGLRVVLKSDWDRPIGQAQLSKALEGEPTALSDDQANFLGVTWKHSTDENRPCSEGVYVSPKGTVRSVTVLRTVRSLDGAMELGSEIVRETLGLRDARLASPMAWGEIAKARGGYDVEYLGQNQAEATRVIEAKVTPIGDAFAVGVIVGRVP